MSQVGAIRAVLSAVPGVRLVDGRADVVVAHQDYVGEPDRPTVLIERADSALVFRGKVRTLAEHPLVTAVVKAASVKDRGLNNAPRVEGRAHYTILNAVAGKGRVTETPPPMSEQALGKIRCLIPTPLQDLFDPARPLPDMDARRPVPLACVLNTHQGEDDLCGWHRRRALEAAAKVPGAVVGAALMSYPKWVALARRACVVVSPWGYGEMCYRDYDAAACGAVLVKPHTDYVECAGDLFRDGETYLSCRPDFSDLADKVAFVGANWDALRPLREKARRAFDGACETRQWEDAWRDILTMSSSA